jgi:hypothetical protein
MPATKLTAAETARALQVWAQYLEQHDVSDKMGQAVGIDPSNGKVWFGESATGVVKRLQGEGIDVPLLFLRVGSNYYVRKRGRR